MPVETCHVGGALHLRENTRRIVHRPVRPISGTARTSNVLFPSQTIRRFVLGRYRVYVWQPGELIAHAADCDDCIHIGVDVLPSPPTREVLPSTSVLFPFALPAAIATAHRSRWQAPGDGGGRFSPSPHRQSP